MDETSGGGFEQRACVRFSERVALGGEPVFRDRAFDTRVNFCRIRQGREHAIYRRSFQASDVHVDKMCIKAACAFRFASVTALGLMFVSFANLSGVFVL
jgi:hypothetical protein